MMHLTPSYHQLFRRHLADNKRALDERGRRLDAWAVFAGNAERHFQEAANRSKEDWEHLYFLRSDDRRTIQLFTGVHYTEPTSDPTKDGNLEEGAALVISQMLTGSVIVLLYPYESKQARRSKVKILWGAFDHPGQITDNMIVSMVGDFLTYCRVSSVAFAPSANDRQRIERLEEKSRRLVAPYLRVGFRTATRVALILGSLFAACLFVRWIVLKDKGAYLEPIIGLILLGTAGLAALLEWDKESVDDARARRAEDLVEYERDKAMKEAQARENLAKAEKARADRAAPPPH